MTKPDLDLDKLYELAQAAPRKNWRLRKSFHGPKYAWVSWGDEAGLRTRIELATQLLAALTEKPQETE